MNDAIMVWSTVGMACATIALAVFAWKSYVLSAEIKRSNDLREKEDKEFKQQMADLYQAIVVAEIISTPGRDGRYGEVIQTFKAHYKGKTPVF